MIPPKGRWPRILPLAIAGFAVLSAGGCAESPPAQPPCVPRGLEICNGIDDDCDGLTDNVYVIAPETCNGLDDDCNGLTDEDVVPAPEECNGRDDDCDGLTDEDVPIGPEVCNGLDDDCNGVIDDGVYGVVSGPWLLAADLPRAFNGEPGAAAVLSDGRILITWVPWDHDHQARYVIVAPAGEILRSEVLSSPYPAEDSAVVAAGDGAYVFVVTGSEHTGVITDHAHTIHRIAVAEDGTSGTPQELWTSPGVAYFMTPVGAVEYGEGVILGLTSWWEIAHEPGRREGHNQLVLLRIRPDGTVAGVWPPPPEMLLDKYGTSVVTATGSFRALWLEEDGTASVMHAGPPDDPFAGPTFPLRGRPPDPTDSILPASNWSVFWTYVVGGLDDRIVAGYPSAYVMQPPPLQARPVGSVVAEYSLHGDHYRVDRAAFVPFAGWSPEVGPGTHDNVLVVGFGSAGPDIPEAVVFWHARDVTYLRTASPTGEVTWEHPYPPFVMQPFRAARDGSLSLVIVSENRAGPTNTYGVILGCLP